MPEAHVNMGFAMLGVQQYAMARDFFDAAIEINVDQLNAYYGLAMALEALGDVGGALGAMRTYVHLSKSDDPFLRKANAAIWEWEEDLKLSRQTSVATQPSQPPASQKKP
jgi:tetratricopeptide (TPR) repeat protein